MGSGVTTLTCPAAGEGPAGVTVSTLRPGPTFEVLDLTGGHRALGCRVLGPVLRRFQAPGRGLNSAATPGCAEPWGAAGSRQPCTQGMGHMLGRCRGFGGRPQRAISAANVTTQKRLNTDLLQTRTRTGRPRSPRASPTSSGAGPLLPPRLRRENRQERPLQARPREGQGTPARHGAGLATAVPLCGRAGRGDAHRARRRRAAGCGGPGSPRVPRRHTTPHLAAPGDAPGAGVGGGTEADARRERVPHGRTPETREPAEGSRKVQDQPL